jgi:TP901 family phage tail tape measure protein
MARSRPFNLTAQLNIQGPNNLRPVIANIRRQLGTLNTNLNLNIDRNASRNIQNLNNQVNNLNNTLRQTATISQQVSTNLNTISAAANNVQQNTGRANATLANTQNTVRTLNNNIQQARDSMEDFGRQSALAIRRFVAFSTAAAPIYALTRAISGAFDELIKFDKEVIRLVQVTGKSRANLSGLTEEITRLSTTLGVSSAELITVSSTLAQAGLSASQTTIALEALAKASLAPSFDDLTNTVEGSIAAMRQFGIASSQLEGALGSINAVAAAFAVEAGDIIAAIQRTGGVFAAASNGVSQGTDALNEFIAVFTSVRATTRESAETIATGLRTIFTRIQRGSTIDFLRELGIQLTDVEGKFVGPFKAVERLSAALRTLDPRDLRYSQIVEELGGFRQIGKVIPLIQQFATAQQALKVAQEGSASLTRDAVVAQQSLANQFTKVREEFLAFVRSIGESKTFQNITKLVLGLASSLISVGKAFKPILPYLAILGAIRGTQAAVSFGRGFFGGGGGNNTGGANTGPATPPPTGAGGGNTGSQQNILNNATVVANTNAITAHTTALGSNTTALTNMQSSLNNLATTFVNGVNALSRVITGTVRGQGGQTLNNGGKVLAFARGGVVPGSGNRDTVPAMLQPGEFVIRKKAVETIGADKLYSMNKYATGGPVRASELPSVEIKQRVKSANSKEAKNNPELFKKGYYITDSDQIVFDKNEYGLKADPNIDPLDFETLVAKKINGTLIGGNAPVDIINSKKGNIEVRSRIRTTKDKVLLDKFLRQRIKDNKPLISNSPNKDDLKFADPVNVVYNTGKLQRDRFKKLNTGGIIQKFVRGGTVEDLALAKNMSIEQVLLEQLQALGGGAGIKKIIGAAGGNSLARKALRKDAIESGRYIKEATDLVNQALSKKGTGDAAEQARISKLTKVAVAGLMPIGYSKDFEWDLENNNSVYANVRGLSDRYKDAVMQMQMETSTAASRFAENLQYSDIFGGGEPLAFDFDETLVSGADILGSDGKPDIPKYSDKDAVKENLQKGRLTRLGLKLKDLVGSNPDFIKNTRILTARPQSTADLLASTLQRLGLPYTAQDITGVGQDPGSTGVKKAANLSAIEKLIDDNLENITAVGKAGKKGFLYNEPNPQKALDEIIGQGNIEGAVIEKALALLGANLPPIDQLEANRAVDFPQGLGRAAQFFGVDPNIPTEVKRTLDSSSFEKARAEFSRYFSENKFADGGWVHHFAEGAMVRSTKNRRRGAYGKRGFVPLNSREYEAFAEKAYADAGPYRGSDWSQSAGVPMPKALADYADKIKKYVFETGGAGISLGKKLVKIPDDIDPEALEALKEDLIKQYDGWYSEIEEVMPFGKEIATRTPAMMEREARTQAAARAEEANKAYAQAEDAIGLFKKTGQLSIDPSMDTYIRGTFPEYIRDLEEQLKSTKDADEKTSINRKLSKAQKAMPDYMALMGGISVPNQGRITGLSETLYALLDQYGSKDVSVNEIDNIMKALGSKIPDTKRFAMGGKNEDTVPALLTPGEFVINKKAASRIGEQQLNRLNKADKMTGFNKGGAVGSIQRFNDGGMPDARGSYRAGFIGSGGLNEDQSFIPLDMLANQANRLAQAQQQVIDTTNQSNDATNQLANNTMKTNRIFAVLNTISPNLAGKFREMSEAMGGWTATAALATTTLSTQLPALYQSLDRFAGTQLSRSGAAAGIAGGLQQGGANLFAGVNASQAAGFGTTGTAITGFVSTVGGAISGYLQAKEQKDTENLRRYLQESDARLETLFGRLEQGNLAPEKRAELIAELDKEISAADSQLGSALENAGGKFETTLAKLAEATSGVVITFAALKAAVRRSDGGIVYANKGTYVKYQPKGTDTVPAMLTPGEFVVNAKSTRKNLGLLNAINKNKGGVIHAQNLNIGGIARTLADFIPFVGSGLDIGEGLTDILTGKGSLKGLGKIGMGLGFGALDLLTLGGASLAKGAVKTGGKFALKGLKGGAGAGLRKGATSALDTAKNFGNQLNPLNWMGRSGGSKFARGRQAVRSGQRGAATTRALGPSGRRGGGGGRMGRLVDMALLAGSIGSAIPGIMGASGPSQADIEKNSRRAEGLETKIRRGSLEGQEFDTNSILRTLNQAGGMQEGAARDEFLTQSGTSPIVRGAEEAALAGAGIDDRVLIEARQKSEADRTEQEKKAIETADAARQRLFEDAFLKTSQLSDEDKQIALNQAQQEGAQAASEARASGKQLTAEQIKLADAYDKVYGVGKKYIAQQSEQILSTERNNRLIKESQAAAENFVNAINTIEAGLQRAAATFGEGMLQIDNSLGVMEGRIPKVSRLTEDIFGNLRAYRPEEIAKASGDLAKSFGFDKISTGTRVTAAGVENVSLADTLKEASLATRALEVDLPRIFRENAGAVGGGDIRKQIQEGLMTGGVSEDTAKTIAKEIADRASSQTAGGKSVSFAALAQDVPGFLNSIESLKKANELQAKLIKTINDSLDTYNSKIQEAAERTVEASRIRADSARTQADFQVSLKQALGKRTTLGEETAGFDAGIRELTTIRGAGGVPLMQGTTDPAALQRRSEAAQQELNRLTQEQQAAGAGGFGDKQRDTAMKMQTEIIKKSNEALKKLAEDGSRAAAALGKVQELSQVRQARRGGIMKLLSNMDNPEAMMEQGRIMGATQRVKGGNASLQDIQLVAQNFDEITSMMDPAMAQRFTQQFKDLVKNIPGLTDETKKFIEGAFNPQSDPAVQQAIRVAEAFKNQQIEAQKILATNLEEASQKIMDGLPTAAEEFRKIILQAATEAANELSRQSRERLFQGAGNAPVALAQDIVNQNNLADLFDTGAANINAEAFKGLLGGEQPKLDFAALPELITSGALSGTTQDGRSFQEALSDGDFAAIEEQLKTGKDFSININELEEAIQNNQVKFDDEQLKIITGENAISVSIKGLEALDNANIDLNLSDAAQQQLDDFINAFRQFKLDNPTTLARGGVVYANKGRIIGMQPKGTDTVPAMLTPGEFVINKSATAKNLPLLKAINSGKTKGYNKGGILYAANGSMVNNVPMSEDGFKSTIDMGEGFDNLWAIDYGGELDKPQNDPNAVRKWIESALEFIRSGRNGGFDKLKSIASQTPWKQKYLDEFSLAIDDIANTDPSRLAEKLSKYKDAVFSQWRNPRQQAYTKLKENTIQNYNIENLKKSSIFDLPEDPNQVIAAPSGQAPTGTGTTETVARDIENKPWNQYAYKISTTDANIPEIWDKVKDSKDFTDVPAGIPLTPLSEINADIKESGQQETREGDSIVAWSKLALETPEEIKPTYNELSADYYDELTYKEWLKKIMGMGQAPQPPLKTRFKTPALYVKEKKLVYEDGKLKPKNETGRYTAFDARQKGDIVAGGITDEIKGLISTLSADVAVAEDAKTQIETGQLEDDTRITEILNKAFNDAIIAAKEFNKIASPLVNEQGQIKGVEDNIFSIPDLRNRLRALSEYIRKTGKQLSGTTENMDWIDNDQTFDLSTMGEQTRTSAGLAKGQYMAHGGLVNYLASGGQAKDDDEQYGLGVDSNLGGSAFPGSTGPTYPTNNLESDTFEDASGMPTIVNRDGSPLQTVTETDRSTRGIFGAKGIESQFKSAYNYYQRQLGEYNVKKQREQRNIADRARRPGLYMSNGGNVPSYYADGGNIFKPRGTDTVPAMLTPGEFVVNRKATQANLGLLHQINSSSGTRYYNKGGYVNYLQDGGQATSGSMNMGIDFSPFMDGVTQFSTYVTDFTNAVNNIPVWDFSEFNRGITTFSNAISILTGSLGPINTAAAAFGTATQNISQAVTALANIPTTITINGRIDMPTQIVVTVEGNTAGADTTVLTKEIINKVALGLSQGNPQINVSSLLNQT